MQVLSEVRRRKLREVKQERRERLIEGKEAGGRVGRKGLKEGVGKEERRDRGTKEGRNTVKATSRKTGVEEGKGG